MNGVTFGTSDILVGMDIKPGYTQAGVGLMTLNADFFRFARR